MGEAVAPSEDSLIVLEGIWASPSDSIFDSWKTFSLESWKGKPAQKETLEEIISDLLHAYSQNGFPFAEISPRVEEAGTDKARLHLSIIAGPAVYVSRLQCAAFSAGEQKQLVRMLAFYPGYFDEREVEGLKNRSQQFPELVWDGESKLAEEPDFSSARLELPLSRRAKNRVAGGLGYLPSGSDNGAFGELSVELVTLGKIGREVDFRWNRPNRQTRSLALGYQDFFLAPTAFYAFGNLNQEEREEQFFRFSAQAGVSALVADGWKAGFVFSYDRITPRRGAIPAPPDSAAARQYELGIEIHKGKEILSEDGYFGLDFQVGYKKVFHGSQIKTGTPKQVGGDAAKSFRLKPAWSVFLKGSGKARFVPAFLFTRSDLFYLGGYGSVRGYPDESFFATRYFLGRMEPRFHLGGKDYLFGFFDFAQLSIGQNSSGLSVSDRFKPGVGLGISAGGDRLILVFGWGEKAKAKDGIVYLRLSGEL
ncbi:MAG: hypothetical protein L0Z48_02695 [candidate division Zixibacteria bacterium]|nr:hypothetical protein [candidate division Zixibacteria bacterium]